MEDTMKASKFLALFLFMFVLSGVKVYAHCEIPCGIYDDHMRIHMMEEHVTTIEKSMNEILNLQKQVPLNYNQIVRWVNNKDAHADKLREIVTQYFMDQRVKPATKEAGKVYDDYVNQLTLLHQIMVHAMLSKQTLDLTHIDELRSLIAAFDKAYFKNEAKK